MASRKFSLDEKRAVSRLAADTVAGHYRLLGNKVEVLPGLARDGEYRVAITPMIHGKEGALRVLIIYARESGE